MPQAGLRSRFLHFNPHNFPRSSPRSKALRLTPSASLAVELTLSNSGEDAYWVQLRLAFPWGLSFRKVEVLKVRGGRAPDPLPVPAASAPLGTQQPGAGSHKHRSSGHNWGHSPMAILSCVA